VKIFGTKITDAGLVHLKGLKKLRYLTLVGSNATQAGVDDLQRSLPDLEIDFSEHLWPTQ